MKIYNFGLICVIRKSQVVGLAVRSYISTVHLAKGEKARKASIILYCLGIYGSRSMGESNEGKHSGAPPIEAVRIP